MSRDTKTTKMVDGIIQALATTGAITVSLAAPNLASFLDKHILWQLDSKHRSSAEFKRIVRHLRRQKLVTVESLSSEYATLRITENGKVRLQKITLDQLILTPPKHWDRKWRLVLFDIPEKHKVGRNALIKKLKALGFFQLQRSSWVHPFPCQEEIAVITELYEITPFVTVAEITDITHRDRLIAYFAPLLKSLGRH